MAVAITTPTGNTHTYAAGSTLTISGVFGGTPTGGTLNLSNVTFATPLTIAQGGTARTTALARFTATGPGAQEVAEGVYEKIAVDTVIQNVGGYFDTTNNRWGPLPAGNYMIGLNCVADNALWVVRIYKNGAVDRQISSNDTGSTLTGSTIVTSDGDDYFEFWTTHFSGGNKNVYAAEVYDLFWGQEIL